MSYYIRIGDEFLIMDAHTSIRVKYPARTTSHPTHARTNKSDNYTVDNPTASVNGIVSDVITPLSSSKISSGSYVDKIKAAIRGQQPVKFKHRLDGEEESNWFITSLDPSQDNANGYGGSKADGSVVQSFKISITLEQVDLAEGITQEVEVPKAYIDALQKKETKSSTTSSYPDSVTDTRSAKEKAQDVANEARGLRDAEFKAAQDILDKEAEANE